MTTTALRASAKGARIISAGIHMSDIPSFPYEQLWGERVLGSVANLTRQDGEEFLALAPEVPVRTEAELHLSGTGHPRRVFAERLRRDRPRR